MKRCARLWMLVAVLVAGCQQGSLPQPGDTVSPRLVQELQWQAGEQGELLVDLAATGSSGSMRRLGFAASPKINPTADARFYDAAGQLIASEQVELSHRC